MQTRKTHTLLLAGLALCTAQTLTTRADAVVQRKGEWKDDPAVTLNLDAQPRSKAVQALAKEAGWSLVFRNAPTDPIDVHVTKQPASKVLELILQDADYVASRDGDLISLAPTVDGLPSANAGASASAAVEAPKPPEPVVAPEPPEVPSAPSAEVVKGAVKTGLDDADDRFITGGSVTIKKDESVKDLVVMGGSADIFGTVTGDVVVMGGRVRLHDSAVVEGDATAIGGSLTVDKGCKLKGDAGVIGGVLNRHDKSSKGRAKSKAARHRKSSKAGGKFMHTIQEVGRAITSSAMLFVFGAVLFALATRRMESLQSEVAGRPMRSFALGVVGLIGGLLLAVALCVTVVGIPVAVIGVLCAVFAAYSGICAVLSTVGAALVKHRSDNVYVHLAVGCAVFLVLGALPWVGEWVTMAVILTGIGSVIATRGAGVVPPRRGEYGGGPYRSAAA